MLACSCTGVYTSHAARGLHAIAQRIGRQPAAEPRGSPGPGRDDDARRLGLEEQVKGIDIRAAQRLESLQTRYAEAKTDADRAKIAKEIRDLSGKGDGSLKDNFMVVGGGQEWDAQAGAMRNVPQRVIDLRTNRDIGAAGHQVTPQTQQGGAPQTVTTKAQYDALPKGAQYVRNGITYTKE